MLVYALLLRDHLMLSSLLSSTELLAPIVFVIAKADAFMIQNVALLVGDDDPTKGLERRIAPIIRTRRGDSVEESTQGASNLQWQPQQQQRQQEEETGSKTVSHLCGLTL